MPSSETGDILAADAEALVNTVNCVGFMSRGIALQFRNASRRTTKPIVPSARGANSTPEMFVFPLATRLGNPRYIINFPTKDHWKGKSRLEFIDSGLEALVREVKGLGIRSIAIPPLGCGLGGLTWKDVRPRIEAAFRDLT